MNWHAAWVGARVIAPTECRTERMMVWPELILLAEKLDQQLASRAGQQSWNL